MALRVDGRVRARPRGLPRAPRAASSSSSTACSRRSTPGRLASEGYGARLARDLGATAAATSATTPAATSPRNGRDLARAARRRRSRRGPCRSSRSRSSGTRWAGSSRAAPATTAARSPRTSAHVVSLGTPHAGAPLAQGVHHAAHALARAARRRGPLARPPAAPQRRASATCAARRSSTRTGRAATPTPCGRRPARRCRCSRAPPTASSPRRSRATATTRSAGWSATGSCSRRARAAAAGSPFDAANGLHVGGAHHLALLDHPAVYAKLRDWLRQRGG